MLTPDAKQIWKSKAGGDLMAALLGNKPMDDADKDTVKRLNDLSNPVDHKDDE